MLSKTRAYYVLKEFTDFVLVDEIRDSIVVSVKDNHYKVVRYEMKKYGYSLVHKSAVDNKLKSLTLVFMILD